MASTLRDGAPPFVPGALLGTPPCVRQMQPDSAAAAAATTPTASQRQMASVGLISAGAQAVGGGGCGVPPAVNSFKVTAAPFVPSGSPRTPAISAAAAAAAPSPVPAGRAQLPQLTSSAQPFVPAAAVRAAGIASAADNHHHLHPNKGGVHEPPLASETGFNDPMATPTATSAATSPLTTNSVVHIAGPVMGRGVAHGNDYAPPNNHANAHHVSYSATVGGAPGRGRALTAAAASSSAGTSTLCGAVSDATYAARGAQTSTGIPGGGGGGAFISRSNSSTGPSVSASSMSPIPSGMARGGGGGGGGGSGSLSSWSRPQLPSFALHSPSEYRHLRGGGSAKTGSVHHTHAHHQHHQPGRSPLLRQFLDETIRQQLQAAAYATHAQCKSAKDSPAGLVGGVTAVPDRIQNYHTLLPLDVPAAQPVPAAVAAAAASSAIPADNISVALSHLRTHVYKGVSSADGQPYVLRRVDGRQIMPGPDLVTAAHQAIDRWAPLSNHPNVVPLRAAFVSSEVESTASLFCVYDFYPGCVTLAAAHMAPSLSAGGVVSVQPPTESKLCSYLVQLTAALRAAHSHGLAFGHSCLHPSKVLVSPTGRLRINCCGLMDALSGDPTREHEDAAQAQRLDLTALGQLLMALACAGLVPAGHPGSLDLLSGPAGAARAGPELCRLMHLLLGAADGGIMGTVRQLCQFPLVYERALSELENGEAMNDVLFHELGKECENGRLLRLLMKLGFVVERPLGDVEGPWAETGDRYLLQLFRDFLFFQRVPEGDPGAGGPLLDWGYVIEALNKLDAGVSERVMLLSRDESSMLIAAYADVKRCVEAAYAELLQHSRSATAASTSAASKISGRSAAAGGGNDILSSVR